MRNSIIAFILSTTFLACGGVSSDADQGDPILEEVGTGAEPIIGGDPISPEESGFVKLAGGGCSATLLYNQWILTAKHCNAQPGTSATMGSQSTTVARLFDHPTVDVSVARLSAPFTMNGGQPRGFRRVVRTTPPVEDQILTCRGYGRFTDDGGGGTLRQALLPVWSVDEETFTVDDNDDNQILWLGDSGTTCLDSSGRAVGVQSTCNTFLGSPTSCNLVRTDLIWPWIRQQVRGTPGDFNGDGKADILATGVSWWNTLPIAFSNGNNTFTISNKPSDFNSYSSAANARVVTGDFNADGLTDLAVVGPSWGNYIAVTLSKGDGTFLNTALMASDFNGAASQAGAKVIAGDFNGDGFIDLAATGVSWWNTIPIAFSKGDGSFTYSNLPSTFNQFSSQPGVKVLSVDINGDGLSDIAATGGAGWTTFPVAISNGDGTFHILNPSSPLNQYSSQPGAKVVAGNFDHGATDFLITGPAGWSTVPLVYDGLYNDVLTNSFAGVSSQAGAQLVVGDFDGNGVEEVAATGVSWWTTMPIMKPVSNGFVNLASTFNQFSSQAGAKVVSGGW